MDLSKILFPHMLGKFSLSRTEYDQNPNQGGSSVVNDEHLRSLFFGDYMFPEAEAKIYDEVKHKMFS